MTSSTPHWLNSQFLEKTLQTRYTNDKIKVRNFILKPSSNDGNYGSKIYRVHVTFDVSRSNEATIQVSILINTKQRE